MDGFLIGLGMLVLVVVLFLMAIDPNSPARKCQDDGGIYMPSTNSCIGGS